MNKKTKRRKGAVRTNDSVIGSRLGAFRNREWGTSMAISELAALGLAEVKKRREVKDCQSTP